MFPQDEVEKVSADEDEDDNNGRRKRKRRRNKGMKDEESLKKSKGLCFKSQGVSYTVKNWQLWLPEFYCKKYGNDILGFTVYLQLNTVISLTDIMLIRALVRNQPTLHVWWIAQKTILHT